MTGVRAIALLVALSGIAFAVVWSRGEQTRVAARILNHEARWVELRRELWAVQTSVARLRTPQRVYDRYDWFGIDLDPPRAAGFSLRDYSRVLKHAAQGEWRLAYIQP